MVGNSLLCVAHHQRGITPICYYPEDCRMIENYDPFSAPDPEEWNALDEHERLRLLEDYHRRTCVPLPNAKVHAIIHVVVENQIGLGDETPVARTLQRLMSEGLDRHDALHAIGFVLVGHMHDLVRQTETESEQAGDPNEAYFAELERLTAESWRRSG